MLRQILAITLKDLKIFFKDIGAVVLIFLMPFMFIVIMSYALADTFGSVRDNPLPLPVADEDGGAASAALLSKLDGLESLRPESGPAGETMSREQVEKLVRNGDRKLGLVLPEGLSDALSGGKAPDVELVLDPATPVQFAEPILGTLRGIVERVWVEKTLPSEIDKLVDSMGVPGLGLAGAREGIKDRIKERMRGILGAGRQPYPGVVRVAPAGMHADVPPDPWQQNVPGYTIFGIFWIVVLLAESVLQERRDGTFRRLLVSPMSRAVMLGGKLLPYYLINLMQIAVMLATARLVFGMRLGSSPAGLVIVSLAAAAAATGLGVLVSSLARTEAQTRGLTILVLLTLAALGGCFVPRFVMPEALRTLGLVTPHAWALDAYQDLLVKGLGLADVVPEVGVLLVFAVLFFGAGVWRFRFE